MNELKLLKSVVILYTSNKWSKKEIKISNPNYDSIKINKILRNKFIKVAKNLPTEFYKTFGKETRKHT